MNSNLKKGFGALVSAVMAFSATGAQAILAQEVTMPIEETDQTPQKKVIKTTLTTENKEFGEAKAGEIVDAKVATTLDLKDVKADLLKQVGASATRHVTDQVMFTAVNNTVTVELFLEPELSLDTKAIEEACAKYKNDLATVKFVPASNQEKNQEMDQLVFTLDFEKLFKEAVEEQLTVAEFIESIPDTLDLELTISEIKVNAEAKPASTLKMTTNTESFMDWTLTTDQAYTVKTVTQPVQNYLSFTVTNKENVAMYRMYNPNSGEHFYTADAKERDSLVVAGWNYEMIGWVAPVDSKTPVYRLYNANAGDHHYTTDKDEHDALVGLGWTSENIGWYSDDQKGLPLYRQYNPNAQTGSHNFTTSTEENDALVKLGWVAEGIAWYAVK